ncbi:MAG: hypothetical protein V7771_05670 [Shewanella psychromarinicola]|jgi:hypothetical protein|uniref:hypothetical protein n=1 Tax=Shewanella TaxID=22 RepID=UPI000C31CDCF|nr:hypothetical protein [Shewanella sp. Actino-trap-3]PKG79068.1 hypothetical protein CXF80_12500 [Shewanella sp. Actino-trap-3]|tara:strand:+ start:26628 stop:27137 length:510 start_codon:yes stop_codon:yes gene_type:complete
MIITTHYPQVPLATSNVATDLARVDNQRKPPILPPQEPAKGHQERSLNPQNERAAAYIVAEKKQQQEQAKRQQQNLTQQQSVAPKSAAAQAVHAKTIRVMASHTPALQRKDIQLQTQTVAAKKTAEPWQRQLIDAGVSKATYQQFGQRIGQFYQQQSAPNNESQLQILA